MAHQTRSKGISHSILIQETEYSKNVLSFQNIIIQENGQPILAKTRWTATINNQPACFDFPGLYQKVYDADLENQQISFQICHKSMENIDPMGKIILTVWIYDVDGDQRLNNLSFQMTAKELGKQVTPIPIEQLPHKKRKRRYLTPTSSYEEEGEKKDCDQLLALLKEQTRCEHDLYIARKIINARGQQLAEIGAKIRRISIKK